MPMDYAYELKQKVLQKLPNFLVVIIVFTLLLPFVRVYLLGDHFALVWYWQSLFMWSAFLIALISCVLALIQYRLFSDKIALLIGFVALFFASLAAWETVLMHDLAAATIKFNLDALISSVTSIGSGLIFLIGSALTLRAPAEKIFKPKHLIAGGILICVLTLLAVWLLDKVAYQLVKQPYEMLQLVLYVSFIVFFYNKLYKKYPSILTNCLLYMALTQIAMACYGLFFSIHPAFLNIIFFAIPFICFMIRYNVTYQTISEARGKLRLSQAKLKHLSAHDMLTKFYNRREFEEIITSVIANADLEGAAFALTVVDIDNFKSINYSFGHLQGDAFLKAFASQLSHLTRSEDIISRIDGDEFAIIAPKLCGLSATQIFAKRLIKGLNNPYFVDGKLVTLTVSMGIAIYPHDALNAAELLMNAEVAMYTAKKTGKNSYQFYTRELSHLQHRETEIVSYLKEAIKHDELTLYYQPIYDLVAQEIIGAEVLLRWFNPILGNMLPDEFIPIAESTGLIVEIGEWILRKVCAQTQQWAANYNKQLMYSINVSPAQFSHKKFVTNFKKIIAEFSYPAAQLQLEITENLLMNDNEATLAQLKQFDAMGIKISLDDFGMGYSSLSRLKSFPISQLKIDRSFIMDIVGETDRVALVDTLIQLGQSMGMTIIAEGIETESQLNYLIARQCYIGQGFYLSIPLPADEFEKLAFSNLS